MTDLSLDNQIRPLEAAPAAGVSLPPLEAPPAPPARVYDLSCTAEITRGADGSLTVFHATKYLAREQAIAFVVRLIDALDPSLADVGPAFAQLQASKGR
jgi:hypothetical protein